MNSVLKNDTNNDKNISIYIIMCTTYNFSDKLKDNRLSIIFNVYSVQFYNNKESKPILFFKFKIKLF